MSQSASQYAAFAREVAAKLKVWTIKDDGGFPAPKNSQGTRSQPFWSSLARVERVIATVPAYAGFHPVELTWEVFRDRWVPGLEKDGLLVGVNWSGKRAVGYDIVPQEVRLRVEYEIGQAEQKDRP
jgi:hypothetical protein